MQGLYNMCFSAKPWSQPQNAQENSPLSIWFLFKIININSQRCAMDGYVNYHYGLGYWANIIKSYESFSTYLILMCVKHMKVHKLSCHE